MNFSKLSASDRMAAIAAVATVVGAAPAASTYPGHWGVTWLGAILAIGMLVVIFLPQVSPTTKLPGRKGSLMVAIGGIAAALMAFVLLTTLDFTFTDFDIYSVFFLIGVAGALVMGWTGWQAFQAEGGKFNIGMAGGASGASAPSTPPPAAPPDAPPAAPVDTPPPPSADVSSEDERQA